MHRTFWVMTSLACLSGPWGIPVGKANPLGVFDGKNFRKWEEKSGAPAAVAKANGMQFSCPFDKDVERFYWDYDQDLDLGKVSALELDLTVVNARACRMLSLYFRSGAGWYHWSRPVQGSGRQRFLIARAACYLEGTPAGWNRVDRIRFSPWKGRGENVSFTVHGLRVREYPVLLVRGTSSLADSEERSLSRRAAQRFSRWLTDLGIPHGAIDDEGVKRGGLKGARVAVLCYNAQPDAEELRVLKTFLDAGGKLVVCYSASDRLAKLMDVQLGPLVTSEEPGQWASMSFDKARAKHFPALVYDVAWNLLLAGPGSESSASIATWNTARGASADRVACVRSRNGFWLSHVLRGGDPSGMKSMILAMLGECWPKVWRIAACHALQTAGCIDPAGDLRETLDGLRNMNAEVGNPAVKSRLSLVPMLHRQMTREFVRGDYPAVMEVSATLHQRMVEAYGILQPARRNEFRGVWDHDGVGWVPGDWRMTCRILSQNGINAVFPNLAWPSKAHYPSSILPVSETARRFGDQLKQCVEAAREYRLAVHVWKICWNLENAPENLRAQFRREQRLQQDVAGNERAWLCPSHPDNVKYELDAIREILERESVDGVHLDYIRYPDTKACYCPTTREAFETTLGHRVSPWPRVVLETGRYHDRFREWRARGMTRFVRRVKDTVRAVDPRAQVSAAVFRRYPSCRDNVGQDWPVWLKEGIVDFVCPMNYTEDDEIFAWETREQLLFPGAANRIFPGIGVSSGESQLRAEQVLRQINLARQAGAPGYVFFDLSPVFRDDVLPVLRLGATGKVP